MKQKQPNNFRRSVSFRGWISAALLVFLALGSGRAEALTQPLNDESVGQKRVTLDMTDASLSEILTEIREQTGVNFISSADDLNNARRVRAVFVDTPIQTVLDRVMQNQALNYKFSDDYVVISRLETSAGQAQAPQAPARRSVSGRVIADGAPLQGVTIIVRGTTQGNVTDASGSYTINNVDPASVLVFSFIGYTSVEETVGDRTTIDVDMESASTELDEVVVIGYTAVRRAELTASVVTLSSDAITDNVTPDLGSMLQGKVAGMMVTNSSGQPGSEASVLIRGVGTITAGQAPLYVVDGIPGGSYNPNDIETLTVLKDVAATAIYGADGANGVIVITTKHGRRNQAPEFTVRYNGAVTQPMFGRFRMMNGEELYNYWELADLPNFKVLYPELLKQRNFDWFGRTFNNASAQEFHASVVGGTQNTTYMLSVNHYDQKGAIDRTGFKRTDFRMNFTTQLLKNLDMEARVNLGQNTRSSSWGYALTEVAYRGIPWDIPFDENGKPIDVASIPVEDLTWYSTQRQNPFYGNQWNYNRSGGIDVGLDFVFNWHINEWLTATNTTRLTRNSSWTKTYYDGRDFSAVHNGPVLGSRIDESSSYPLGGYNNTTLLKASHRIGKHSIGGMLGYEVNESPGTYRLGGEANGQPTGMDVISTGVASTMRTTGGFAVPSAGWSAFGQATYSWADKYLASVSFRADANTRFAPDRRVGYFPSVSAGWVLSNEEFLRGNRVLTYAKLRASYGVTGNSNIDDFLYMNTYSLSGITYLGVPGAQPSRLANPNLGWETATMLAGGVDFNLFTWLEGSIDLYRNVNTDLLFSAPEEPSSGFYSSTRNIGSVSNRGIEVQLSTTNFNRPDFKWSTSFNISFNKNRVESLPKSNVNNAAGDPIMVGAADSGGRQRLEEGRELYSWYLRDWRGVDPQTGDPLWWGVIERDAQGNATKEGLTSVYDDAIPTWFGSASPKFSGGLVNNLSYKGFSLGVSLYFIYGNTIYINNVALQDDGARMQYNQPAMPKGLGWTRWEKAGDVAEFPKLVYNNPTRSTYPSSRYLFDGSFLRVRNVNVGYSLPERVVSRVGLKSARIFFSGDNLFTLSRVPVPDPETNLSSSGIDEPAGQIGTAYPLNRTFSLGAEIKF